MATMSVFFDVQEIEFSSKKSVVSKAGIRKTTQYLFSILFVSVESTYLRAKWRSTTTLQCTGKEEKF